MDAVNVNWTLCILCQDENDVDELRYPSNNKNKNEGKKTYDKAEQSLQRFHDANILPQSFHPSLKLLIARGNLSELFQKNAAVWHKNCKGKLTVTKFERSTTKKRKRNETMSH